MTTERRLERDLPMILGDLAVAPYPDYIDDVLAGTAQRRQRPAWTFPERWLPMDLATSRVPTARLPWRQLGVLALIGLLIAAALAVYVGTQPRLPAPFGVAANGVVAFVDADGAIRQADPVTGLTEVIVPGPGNERPLFSPDGSRLAYLHESDSGAYEIVVAEADGQRPTVIATEPMPQVGHLSWSPDSATIVVSVWPGRLRVYDAATPGAPRSIEVEGQQPGRTGFDDFNSNTQDIFRPPTGAQIMFIGATIAGPALFVADADGTNARAIIEPTTASYSELDVPVWSPDGSRIALVLASVRDPSIRRIYIVDADGTGLRELSHDLHQRTENNPSWSPDGTKVAFQRWWNDESCGYCVTRPITVVGVDDGSETEVGIINVDGYAGWSWSPDGLAILAVAHNAGEHRMQVAPLTGDAPTYLDVITDSAPSWQRIAP